MMIKYTLNYIEDLKNELLLGKRIICVGVDNTTNNIITQISWVMDKVDYWITYTKEKIYNLAGNVICAYYFDALPELCDDKKVILIVSEYIDYIKHFLSRISPKIPLELFCYSFKLNTRDFSREYLIAHRWKDISMYWTDYYLNALNISNKLIELERKSNLLEKDRIKVLPRIIIVLTTMCNLKCENCIALTPYYKKPYHVSSSVIYEAFDKLSDVVDEITCVELLGGEPFMYPDLENVVKHILLNQKVKILQITTNGIAPIKKDISFLSNERIQVRISDYSISECIDGFITKLNQMGVNYLVQKDIRWKPVGNLKRRNKSIRKLEDEYNLCFEGLNCKTVLNGKLFSCTFSSRLYDLNYSSEIEYIDLLNENVTWSYILDFFTQTFSNGCRYCSIMDPNIELIQSAIQCS